MIDVFVARQSFEDSGDDQTLGVYTDFWKAIEGTNENRKANDWEEYKFKTQDIHGMIWRELIINDGGPFHGHDAGIYYTIEKMELE